MKTKKVEELEQEVQRLRAILEQAEPLMGHAKDCLCFWYSGGEGYYTVERCNCPKMQVRRLLEAKRP